MKYLTAYGGWKRPYWTDQINLGGEIMADQDLDEFTIEPKENPTDTGHLPVSGEVGAGPVTYHDPLTHDTTDDSSEGVATTEDEEGQSSQ